MIGEYHAFEYPLHIKEIFIEHLKNIEQKEKHYLELASDTNLKKYEKVLKGDEWVRLNDRLIKAFIAIKEYTVRNLLLGCSLRRKVRKSEKRKIEEAMHDYSKYITYAHSLMIETLSPKTKKLRYLFKRLKKYKDEIDSLDGTEAELNKLYRAYDEIYDKLSLFKSDIIALLGKVEDLNNRAVEVCKILKEKLKELHYLENIQSLEDRVSKMHSAKVEQVQYEIELDKIYKKLLDLASFDKRALSEIGDLLLSKLDAGYFVNLLPVVSASIKTEMGKEYYKNIDNEIREQVVLYYLEKNGLLNKGVFILIFLVLFVASIVLSAIIYPIFVGHLF